MGERDEVARALRRHDPREARGGEDVAFRRGAIAHELDRRPGDAEQAARDRTPFGYGLRSDVDHPCSPFAIDVRELLGRGHYLGSDCSVRITSTISSLSMRVGPTGRSMRQFASDIDRRIPEPCGPVRRTVPASGSWMPRAKKRSDPT